MPLSTTDIADSNKHDYVMDPGDTVNYGVDWGANYLENGVTISSATAALSSAATTAGLQIDSTTNDDTTTQIQVSVDPQSSADAAFDPPGTEVAYKWTLTLSNGEVREESWAFTVRQK